MIIYFNLIHKVIIFVFLKLNILLLVFCNTSGRAESVKRGLLNLFLDDEAVL